MLGAMKVYARANQACITTPFILAGAMSPVTAAGTLAQVLAKNIDLSENGQAMDAIREVGPGTHFLGCAHTQANFETAFYRSSIADNNSYEQWEAEGAQDAAQRANKLWKRMLREYEAPPLDPATVEALLAFIAKRKAASPDSNV
jgi:trimethylamine--corrinoid protein Co-methyltransferase